MYHNPYFDVNLLENALSSPTIDLAIPLPHEITDSSSNYLNLPDNSPVVKNFSLLLNFIDFFTTINVHDIYAKNEYYYAVNKFNPKFINTLRSFVDNRLEKDDAYLDELIYKLIDQELNLNLITSKQLPERFKQVKEFMVEYYKAENHKNFPLFHKSSNFIRICYITVIKVLMQMFPDGIWCNNLEVSKIYQQYLKDPMSIVFLPCHKSHFDYIIVHILSIRFQMPTPTVIAGDNLNVAIFGKILKQLGAIFIKRSFNNELYTEKNLTNLLEFLVMHDVNIEVFIEGTRSRDGKLLIPKYGILKMLQQVYESTKKDMIVQPMLIIYERIFETDGYLKELIGKDKKQESFVGILKNGINGLVGGKFEQNPEKIIKKQLPYDNMPLKLSGKIYVKFGQNSTLSSYNGKLKKIGYNVFHEINRINHLPEISIVGTVIQIYAYLNPEVREIPMSELIELWPLILELIKAEIVTSNTSNLQTLDHLQSLKEEEVRYLFKYQIIKFLKFIRVDTKTDQVILDNSIELLYYKNLTIHLLISRSLVSFSLLHTTDHRVEQLAKVNHTLKTLLKSEFLFDYNTNKRDEFGFIINDMIAKGKIDDKLNILDKNYHQVLASLVYPFLKSYMLCAYNIVKLLEPHKFVSELKLINDQLHDFPDTKKLLKQIQRNAKDLDFESTNKQYLLSGLYYLNYLQLIKIFKNKSKTVAYVKIEDQTALDSLLKFFGNLFNEEENDLDMDYLVDVIENKSPRSIKL